MASGIDMQGGDNDQIGGNYIGTNSAERISETKELGCWIRAPGPNGAVGDVIGGETDAEENMISRDGRRR